MLGGEMVFSNGFERRFGWLAFPGFLRYFALLHMLVYLLQIVRPGIGLVLMFNWDKILGGEVWRVVTFLFASSGFDQVSSLGMIFMVFMVMIAFMINDALEEAWGVFKASMFYYCGIAGLIAASMFYPMTMLGGGMFLYESAFFAFATLFPRVEFRLFFILPVQVRWLAILGAVVLVGSFFGHPGWLLVLPLSFVNYLLWAGIPALRGKAREVSAGKRRGLFKAAQATPGESFHHCETCGKTEHSDAHLEFRVGLDGKEYCEEHIDAHQL